MIYLNFRSIPELSNCTDDEKYRVWHYSMKKSMHGKILFYQIMFIVACAVPAIVCITTTLQKNISNWLLGMLLSYVIGFAVLWICTQISKLLLLNIVRKEVPKTLSVHGSNVPDLHSGFQ